MRRLFTVAAATFLFLMSGCAGPNSGITTKNIETAAAIDSAFVPGAAIIGVPFAAVDVVKYLHDYYSSIGMPSKETKFSPKLNDIWSKTNIGIEFDKNRQFVKRYDYAIWRGNGQKKKVYVKDIPKNWLNQRSALERAIAAITQGNLADDDTNLLKHNLEIWKNKGLLVIEYHGYYWSTLEEYKTAELLRKGTEGATVVAVSNKNEPFEIMLPEEWELRKSQYGLAPEKPVIPVEEKTKEGSHP